MSIEVVCVSCGKTLEADSKAYDPGRRGCADRDACVRRAIGRMQTKPLASRGDSPRARDDWVKAEYEQAPKLGGMEFA